MQASQERILILVADDLSGKGLAIIRASSQFKRVNWLSPNLV
jgi:hypothetical protein